MSFNKVILIGNVGKVPDVRHLESGSSVASFPLATTERTKDRNGNWADQTEWHNIVCWRTLADLSEKYITKGTQIMVEGKIRYRQWQDQNQQTRYTTEIIADNIRLLEKKSDNPATSGVQSNYQGGQGGYNQPTPVAQPASTPVNFADESDSSDDLPF